MENETRDRWDVEDMRHIAETGMRFVKLSADEEDLEILSRITIEVGHHPGLKNSLFLKYNARNGPKGFVSLAQAGPDQMTDLGRLLIPGYYHVSAFQRYRGNDDVMIEDDYNDPAAVALIAADILRKVIRTEAARKPSRRTQGAA